MKIIKAIGASDAVYFTQYLHMIEREWEVRLNRGQWRYVFPGDLILLFKRGGKGEFVVLRVLDRKEFPSLRETFKKIDYKWVIPQANSVEEAINHLRKFYSVEDELEHGVLAFKVEPVAVYKGEITRNALAKYLPHFKE